MARTSSKSIAPRTTGTSLANIDNELSNEVATLKQQISQSSGNRLKVEPSGAFTLPDGLDLGDEIQVVVVDFVTRNTFYAGPYNPNNLAPPECYAIGKNLNEMAPEEDSPAVQADKCVTCPLNQFGSASNGTGKACKNSRELAVLLVDPDNPDAHNAPDAPIYTLSLPPTAIKSFDAAVAYVARSLQGPPLKAILTARAKNVGTYALITFTDPVPNPDYAAHYARRAEVQDALYRKPDFAAYAAKAAEGKAGNRSRTAAPARRTATRR